MTGSTNPSHGTIRLAPRFQHIAGSMAGFRTIDNEGDTMIHHGFLIAADRYDAILQERIRTREARDWKRLAFGFGLSGILLSLLALTFLLGY